MRQHVYERVCLARAPPKEYSQEEAARMLLRSGAGFETAVTAVPFRDARVSLPAGLDDTPLASAVVGEEAEKFLSDCEDETLSFPLEMLERADHAPPPKLYGPSSAFSP